MTKPVKTTVEPPDRTTTWAWGGRYPPGRPAEAYRQQDDMQCDNPKREPAEQ
jgi:hypothetical protein